jgi:signal transduction histidine kinase
MPSDPHAAHEPHPWIDLAPNEVLDRLVHELYTPVSALGSEVDRLASGAFEDDDLLVLLDQIRENVNALGRLVVTLKRYIGERERGVASEQA